MGIVPNEILAQPNACVSFVASHIEYERSKRERRADKSAFSGGLQRWIDRRLGTKWSYGGWLEDRSSLLRDVEYLRKNKTFLHLGVDVSFRARTTVLAPLDGEILHTGTDTPLEGGWGGHVVQRVIFRDKPHAFLYVHFGPINVSTGERVQKGTEIGRIGTWSENGRWGPHLHIQLYRDVDKVADWGKFMAGPFDGYGKVSDLTHWAKRCPDPTPLIFA